ncbi:MAG: LysR substrate-binding domain-containing protein, partial [Pseudomonadota bacterium]
LESFLGVTLLYRTTRKHALTNEGRLFHKRAVEVLGAAEAGLNALNAASVEPTGALRVSLPAFLAQSELSTCIVRFSETYQRVDLTLVYTDQPVGLIEDGFDLNIRVGWLDDSAMMSRKIGESGRVLVAGSALVASRSRPNHPNDLEDWPWIHYQQRSNTVDFQSPDGQEVPVTYTSKLSVDSLGALFHFACENAGLTILPEHLARKGEADGRLVTLLPDWGLRTLGYYAVWPDTSRRDSLTRVFVGYLADGA